MVTIFDELLSLRKKRAAERAKRRWMAQFRRNYFSDTPVDLEAMPQYRNEFFPDSGPKPWIDQPDALTVLEQKIAAKTIDPADAEICRGLIVDGYYIARNLIAPDVLDAAWQSYEKALEDKVVSVKPEVHGEGDQFPGRLLDPHLKIPEIRGLLWRPEILRITDLLFGRETVPFQTIIGHKSSQQHPHSDAIHMTTYPLGFLLAAWIAFEDVHPDSGPLVYYPKSHRLLPYLLSAEVGIEMMEFKANSALYNARYERRAQEALDASELRPVAFCASKGDVLFWHANLMHGGSRRSDLRHSRKALVCHYFAKGAFTYHDLSGNASRLHRNGVYSDLANDAPAGDHSPPVKVRGALDMKLKSKWLDIRSKLGVTETTRHPAEMKGDRNAKLAKGKQETTIDPNPHFGRIEVLPAMVYEGPTRMLYRIWARGDANSILRVEADGIVRAVVPPNSVDVAGTKISVKCKAGNASCDYQFLGRGE